MQFWVLLEEIDECEKSSRNGRNIYGIITFYLFLHICRSLKIYILQFIHFTLYPNLPNKW